MINVKDNYKLIDLTIEGESKTVRINTSDAWNVLEFELNGEPVVANEGDRIEFVTESGEQKQGVISKLSGKGEKTKIQINPLGVNHEEIWAITSILENTLRVIKNDENDEEGEEE